MLIEHTLHLPKRNKLEIPYAGDRNMCPFCGAYGFTPGTRCQCGVWNPSQKSYKRPWPPKRRKTPPSALEVYRPQFDGLTDADVPWGGDASHRIDFTAT